MTLSLKTFAVLVRDQVTAAQGRAGQLLDLTVGSVLRAIFEANASIGLWLQWVILQVLALTRASSSTGADLDTWLADYSLTRLQAFPAVGTLRFSRLSTVGTATVPVGTAARTADGSRTFITTAAGTMADGVAFVDVPAVDTAGGTAGNVLPNTITLLGSAVPGVDLVTNLAAFTTGADAASDDAARAGFVVYINTLSRATLAAVGFAILSVNPGLRYRIDENVDAAGSLKRGNFVVTIDDGTGSTPAPLVSSVADAIEAYRPLTVTFTCRAATATTVNVSFAIDVMAGADGPTMVALAAAAVRAHIVSLPIAGTLYVSRIPQVVYDASTSIRNVRSVLVNSGTADVTADTAHILSPGTITVS